MAIVEADKADVARIMRKLERLGVAFSKRVLRQEVNRTARGFRTDAVRLVREDLPRIPAATIRRRVHIDEARGDDLDADVRIDKRSINLSRFGARQTKRGGIPAVETIRGQRVGPFRHAFIIDAKYGSGDNEGVTRIVVQRKREGSGFVGRGPLEGIYGVTVLGVAKPRTPELVRMSAERLMRTLTRRADSELRGRGLSAE